MRDAPIPTTAREVKSMGQSNPARQPGNRKTQLLAVLPVAGCLLLPPPATGAAEPAATRDNQVMATYLVNFLLFITPTHPVAHESFTIALVGNDPFGDGFDSVDGQLLDKGNRKLLIIRLARYDQAAAAKLRNCDLVFITAADEQQTGEILSGLRGSPAITVSTATQFLEAGGMIRLVQQDNQIRWEMNSTALKDAGLSASAQLCRNAARVLDKPAGKQ
jgi:hypothetical protein